MYLIEKSIEWFESYVKEYIKSEEKSDMYDVKIKHSKRVCKIASSLADSMSWNSQREQWLSQSVGLLHDIARFSQHRDYNTFLDSLSFDHGDRGKEILKREFNWDGIDDEDKNSLLEAVQYHNKRLLPIYLTAESNKWCSLVRDADKIDIFRMIQRRIENGSIMDIFPEHESVSGLNEALVEEIEKEGLGSYKNARSLQDYRLIQLTWGVDLNFSISVDILEKENIFEKIIDDLKKYQIDLLIDELMNKILTK